MRDVRDVAIIILAVESIVVGGLLIFLIIQLQRLMKMLRDEIRPILDSTNETVSTVRGTTTFMSEHLISPIFQVASFLSGVRRVTQVVTGWPKASGTAPAAGQEAPANPEQPGDAPTI